MDLDFIMISVNIKNKYIETFLLQIEFSKFTRKLVN